MSELELARADGTWTRPLPHTCQHVYTWWLFWGRGRGGAAAGAASVCGRLALEDSRPRVLRAGTGDTPADLTTPAWSDISSNIISILQFELTLSRRGVEAAAASQGGAGLTCWTGGHIHRVAET